MHRAIRLCLTGFLVALIAANAFGQAKQRDQAKEQAILDQLRKIAPTSVKDFEAGTTAMDAGDYAGAVGAYQKVVDKSPEFDPALRRLGISLAYTGHLEEGKGLIEKAIKKTRSPENLITLADVLAYPANSQATSEAKLEALGLAREAISKVADNDPSYPTVLAQLALDCQSEADFRAAAQILATQHPDLMQTHYFNAIRDAMDDKWVEAEAEIRKAGALGLPPEIVQSFLDKGPRAEPSIWRYAYYALYPTGAWVVGLVLLFVLGKVMSSLTLQSIEADDPNDPDTHRHQMLRKLYRRLIALAGIYYYISIPFVIFLVLAVAGSVTYASIQSGHISVKLIAGLIIGAVVTTYMMIHSLFVRRDQEDPGRALKPEEAPGLWDLARDVAGRVETRPVDEIRITPGTDMAVYERGSLKDRAQDKGHRILILGIATLNGFSQNAFRAVLAHEYGHLSHRDTAGGDIALRVNANMRQFAVSMVKSGQAVWWNLGFQFLRIYHFIFRRLSHGATRLQEVLADRISVMNYGAQPFEEGLRHVIRRSIEFEDIAYSEVTDADKSRRPLQNLYELEAQDQAGVEGKYQQAIARPTNEDDTHPGPLDRFRYAGRITSSQVEPASGMVWDLFTDRESLTKEMNDVIRKNV